MGGRHPGGRHPAPPGRRRPAGGRTSGPDPAVAKRDAARSASLPRRTAYDVLAAVRSREAYANLLLPRLLAERGLKGRDAALATELAYGTLRGLGSYDEVLAACSDRPLAKLDPPVLDILRLGTHQVLSTRVGSHAAVATSVDLAKSVAGHRVAGYVNAVLRRVATRDLAGWLAIIAPDPASDPDGYLAIRHSHPRWVVAAYREALGDAAGTELESALAAGNERPRVTLATLPGGPSREMVMPADAEPGRWSPYAFTIAGGDPGALVRTGLAAVQDEGSQLAALALSRVPVAGPPTATSPQVPAGDNASGRGSWLDQCAGPGGKARLLYGLANQAGARFVAADVHAHRAGLVRDALAVASQPGSASHPGTPAHSFAYSAGAGYSVLAADARQPAWRDATFDRILVDVPCSGLGALRRRPEARWRKQEEDIGPLAALQRDLLRSALDAVRPGGVVGYVTCSPVPAETREVVTAVVGAVAGVEILDAPAVLSEVPGVRSPSPLFAQLWPHRHGTDAIFIALLRRGAR